MIRNPRFSLLSLFTAAPRLLLPAVALCLLLPAAARGTAADDWYRFLIQAAVQGSARSCFAEVLETGRETIRVKVTEALRGSEAGRETRFVPPAGGLRLDPGGRYLFTADSEGRIHEQEPPHPVRRGQVLVDDRYFPLETVQAWIRETLAIPAAEFVKNHQDWYRAKRARERQQTHLWRLSLREAWLAPRIQKAVSLHDKVQWLLELGHLRLSLDDARGAEAAFRMVETQYRLNLRTRLAAGQGIVLAVFQQGRPAEALRLAEGLLGEADPEPALRAALRVDLARLHEKQGAWNRAIELYRQVAAAADENPERAAFAAFNLGEISRENGKQEDAKAHYQEADRLFRRYLGASLSGGSSRLPAWHTVLQRRLAAAGR